MTEIFIDENKPKEKKKILPEIINRQNIPKLKEIKDHKEEINSLVLFPSSKDSENINSEKLFETDNSKRNNEISMKENEVSKSDLFKNKNIKIMENIHIFDNKLYFTETNIQSNPHKNTTAKSSSTKLYSIEVIPEYPLESKKNSSKIWSSNKSTISYENKKSDKSSSNIFSSEIQLKKRIVNKFNFIPLHRKIQEIEDQITKQNEYDFQKAMKDLQFKFEQKMKQKERDKLILENNKKFKNKLKKMEEFRNNIINQKWIKVMKKQNKVKKRKNVGNKSFEYSIHQKTEKNKEMENNPKTIDINASEKEEASFPSIQNLSNLELVKLRKQKSEEEFCFNVQQKLIENDEVHRRNHINYLNSINRKFLIKEKIFRERSYNCLEHIKMKDDEFKENYLKKEILKSYNINQLLEKVNYNRKIKINKIKAQKYNVKENQELIQKKLEEKNMLYQQKLTEQYNNRNKKKINLSYCNTEKMQKKIMFSKKQKENLKNLNQEQNEYYNELILRLEDNTMYINELQKQEGNLRKEIVKRTIDEQKKKKREIANLTKFKGKMKNENIYNFREEKVQEIFNKRRIEEQKKLEAETDIFNKIQLL